MKAISIGKAPDNDCRIHHHSISDHHAVVDVLSGAEYLLRSRGSAPLVVARQSIARAQIDKFTPLQIGQIHITLGELLANPNFEPKIICWRVMTRLILWLKGRFILPVLRRCAMWPWPLPACLGTLSESVYKRMTGR